MNLRDLQYFVTLAEIGHVGQAAERCFVSQPTLSMQIKKLEDELGLALFERQGRRLLLTEAGRQALPHARAALDQAGQLRGLTKRLGAPLAGPMRLGVIPTVAPYLLPLLLPLLREQAPEMQLQLIEAQTDRLMAMLREGSLDMALLALPIADSGLVEARLVEEPFLLAVPATHPLARERRVEAEAMHDEALMLLEDGHCLRDQALAFCTQAGGREATDVRATSLETLRHLVASGEGMTLIPAYAATLLPGLCYVPFHAPCPSRTLGFVWRASHPARGALPGLVAGLSQTLPCPVTLTKQ